MFDFSVNIRNNTSSRIRAELFQPSGFRGFFNSRTVFSADLSTADLNVQTVSITVRSNSSSNFTAYTAPLLDQSIAGVVAALNSLGVGIFYATGNVIQTNNSLYTYGLLNIGAATAYSEVSNFTVSNGADFTSNISIIAVNTATEVKGYIDWGDGVVETFDDTSFPFPNFTLTHNYTAGTYSGKLYLETNPAEIDQISMANSFFTAISFLSPLMGCTSIDVTGNDIDRLDISTLPALQSLGISNNPNFVNHANLIFGANNALQNIGADGCGFTSISFPVLASVSSIDYSNNALTSVNLSNLPALQQLSLSNNQLTSLNLSANSQLSVLGVGNNQIISINITGIIALFFVDVQSNLLPTSQINSLLIACDTGGLGNGTFTSNGQTPAAPPSGAGAAAKANLIIKGWSVTTD
jgi:hypothetical protein